MYTGVPKPGVFWVLAPPTFWRDLKMGVREGAQQKLGGRVEKNLGKKFLGGVWKFLGGKKSLGGKKNF